MILWQKQASAEWLTVNEPRLQEIAGRDLAIIARPGHVRTLAQVTCHSRKKSVELLRAFGGRAQTLPRNWLESRQVAPNPPANSRRPSPGGGERVDSFTEVERQNSAHHSGRGRVWHRRTRHDRDVAPAAGRSRATTARWAGACSTSAPAPEFLPWPRGVSAQARLSVSTSIPAPSRTPARTRDSITFPGPSSLPPMSCGGNLARVTKS